MKTFALRHVLLGGLILTALFVGACSSSRSQQVASEPTYKAPPRPSSISCSFNCPLNN